jgi:hypothetical protein
VLTLTPPIFHVDAGLAGAAAGVAVGAAVAEAEAVAVGATTGALLSTTAAETVGIEPGSPPAGAFEPPQPKTVRRTLESKACLSMAHSLNEPLEADNLRDEAMNRWASPIDGWP